ncbi:MAG: FCD domain-containing protein [Motiliproteus sp.]
MPLNAFAFEKSVKNLTKKEVLTSKLLEMIFTGLLRDGDALPSERELGVLFGVSRETVRGALGMIAAYGLISVAHGSKTRINRNDHLLQRCQELLPELSNLDINHHSIDTIYDSRMVVEGHIARLAVKNIDAPGLDKLELMVMQQRKLVQQPAHFQLSDRRFHKLLSEYSGNEILVKYADDLYTYGLNFRRQALEQSGTIESSIKEHSQIIASLRDGDTDAAEQAMQTHLRSVYQSTIEAMNHDH